MALFPRKAVLAIATFVLAAAIPETAPALKNYRIVEWSRIPALIDFPVKPPPGAGESEAIENKSNPVPMPAAQPAGSPGFYALSEANGALDNFYEALLRTETQEAGAVTRILHYGDSPTTADLITADLRSALQQKFGDAGHGFVLIGKPWAWYGHRGLEITSTGWHISPANQADVHDGLFGLGGVSFRGSAGAVSRISTRDSSHTAVEVSYLSEPGGGVFDVSADGNVLGEVDTNFPQIQAGFQKFQTPSGASHFEIHVKSGSPKVFGWQLSKDGPGIEYNSLGLNGAYISVLSKMLREQHWSEELKHAQPDLVIVNYGTNESVYASFVDQAYTKEVREVIRRIRAALPETSILVMSPMDRGAREASGEIGTVPALTRLVTLQQKVASENNCGFFNTFQAMGGPGTMGRWYQAEPRLVSADFIHPMPNGAKIVGNLLYRSLLGGFNQYKARRLRQKLARKVAQAR
jgi:lysophospholipase L1-like esterase